MKRGARSPARNECLNLVSRNCSKKAQFYLMAAVIIIVIIFSIYTARNYVQVEKEETTVDEARYEMNFESAKVMDWGIYNNEDLDDTIEDWTKTYVTANQDKNLNIMFAYGDAENLTVLTFTQANTGEITLNTGGLHPEFSTITPIGKRYEYNFSKNVNHITVNITEGINYEFTLKKGKSFIFVIKREGYVS